MLPENMMLVGSYDYRLVDLSVVIATFAACAALDLAGRVTVARGSARFGWFHCGNRRSRIFTADNIAQEAACLRAEGRATFERPYELAWLLQLVAELREWDDPVAREMAANLRPLQEAALQRLNE